jgi:hypothetical protein
MIYMVKSAPQPIMDGTKAKLFHHKLLEQIMFLNCGFTNAERRYSLMEIEVTGIVWMVRNIQHFIYVCSQPAYDYLLRPRSRCRAVRKNLADSPSLAGRTQLAVIARKEG